MSTPSKAAPPIAATVDLFGPTDDAAQPSLFAEADLRQPAPRFAPDPNAVRRRLQVLLAVVRDATSMPWPERDARMWQTVFPQMADWLPNDEADQLRFEFAREIERLKAA